MVHRPSDIRLLNSLLSSEKEYHKQLLLLVDTHSRNSLAAFSAYASASPAPIAHAVIAVAGSLAGADDAFRRYAATVEAWQAELRAIKELEEDVGNTLRDREIFVSRIIKLSKNQKPTRDSLISTLGSSIGDLSQTSLHSFTPPGASKLGSAQAELQACEVHLAAKEKELDELRVSAVRRGLEARCKAMVECGWNWGEMGKEGLRALEGIENPATDVSLPHPKLLPDPECPPGSDLSSIDPSQSASQIYVSTHSFAVLPDQPASTPPRAVSPAHFPSRSSSPRPPMPPSSSLALKIPPAHSISELALPSTLERRISEESEDEDHDSSEEDSRPVEVVENTRFASATTTNTTDRLSIRPPRTRDNSGSNTTSSGTGTGTGSFSQPASSTLAPSLFPVHLSSQHAALPAQRDRKGSGGFFSSIAGLFRGGGNIGISSAEKWKTRTESNIRAVRRDVDSDSENGAPTESPNRRLFGRRVSHDAPRSSSPAPPSVQKLRKRYVRAKEQDQGGWISDGAAVGGRGARKGSLRRRATSPSKPPPPDLPPMPTSAHTPSPSVASAVSSLALGQASSTPTRPKLIRKTDLRIEALARSSTTDVSRQSSFRSSGSAPPVPRSLKAGERASSLPPSQSAPGFGIGRANTLSHHAKSNSLPHATAPPRPSHTDAGRAGSGQMSLMAIVEGVTRQNRTAWDRANAGLPTDPTLGTGTSGGLVSVRAPPSVAEYNVRGETGRGIAFETVLAPGSVLNAAAASATPPPPPPQNLAPSSPSAKSYPPPTPPRPLRSALRNHTPPATPPKPIVIPSAPPRVIVVVDPPPHHPRSHDRMSPTDEDGSDSGSVTSFRTVRETLEEDSDPPAAPASPTLVVPGKDESDVSSSTVSASAAIPGTGTGAGANGTVRRKSVRVSLQPTFSPTPPALDEDEDEAWERSGRSWGKDDERNGRDRDFWQDSSDEDEEYSKARKLLVRATKKRW